MTGIPDQNMMAAVEWSAKEVSLSKQRETMDAAELGFDIVADLQNMEYWNVVDWTMMTDHIEVIV